MDGFCSESYCSASVRLWGRSIMVPVALLFGTSSAAVACTLTGTQPGGRVRAKLQSVCGPLWVLETECTSNVTERMKASANCNAHWYTHDEKIWLYIPLTYPSPHIISFVFVNI